VVEVQAAKQCLRLGQAVRGVPRGQVPGARSPGISRPFKAHRLLIKVHRQQVVISSPPVLGHTPLCSPLVRVARPCSAGRAPWASTRRTPARSSSTPTPKPPTPKPKTQNPRPKTYDTKHKTQITNHKPQDPKPQHQIRNTKQQTTNTKHQPQAQCVRCPFGTTTAGPGSTSVVLNPQP